MSSRRDPHPETEDEGVESVPVETDDGETVVIRQQSTGSQNGLGQGEFPDRDTPPRDPGDVVREARPGDIRHVEP